MSSQGEFTEVSISQEIRQHRYTHHSPKVDKNHYRPIVHGCISVDYRKHLDHSSFASARSSNSAVMGLTISLRRM